MRTFYQWLAEADEEEDDEDEEVKSYRPGELDDQGDPYAPETQPDMAEYIWNRYLADYGGGETLSGESGYILPDGRVVQMGQMGVRGDDHRGAIPSSDAMRRWGWPEELITQNDQDTRTPAMRELMRRSGAIRVNVSRADLTIDSETKVTARQRRVILDFIRRARPRYFAYKLPGGNQGYLDLPSPDQVEAILS